MRLHTILVLGLATGIIACAEKEQPLEDSRDTAVMDHMHKHAAYLDKLYSALDEGDFERAMRSAYWLSRHEAVSGLPEDLQPYLTRMREAAGVAENAEDLDSVRAAAEQISAACQDCHSAAGVATQ